MDQPIFLPYLKNFLFIWQVEEEPEEEEEEEEDVGDADEEEDEDAAAEAADEAVEDAEVSLLQWPYKSCQPFCKQHLPLSLL